MSKILRSLLVIAVVTVVGFGLSRAFFSDTEESKGNVFTAGAVDLKIDSTAHYNGMVCEQGTDQLWTWQPETGYTPGPDQYPKQGDPCTGTWSWTDLNGEKFFNFADVKPGDYGENTISIHVVNNPARACLIVDKMVDADNDMTEPEGKVDTTPTSGDLAPELHFFAWADLDGDNVWESGETPLFLNLEGPASDVIDGKVYDLGTLPGAPIDDPTGTTYYGFYWCYGKLIVDQANYKLTCDGSAVTNASQTDSLTADVSFYVEQARNNPDFKCPTLIKVTEGYPTFSHSGGVRYRSLGNTGGREMYLGVSDLGVGINRVEVDFNWSSPGSHPFEFTYDKANDKLVGKLGAKTLEYPAFSTKLTSGCTVAGLNKVQMTIAARHTGTTVDVKNLDLDGNALGDYGAVFNQFKDWTISGYNFSNGFTLKGDIDLTGTFSGGEETSKVQFLVGCAL